MFVGYYTRVFFTSVNPWTTLGPLALVVSVSLVQEGYTDVRRHVSDTATNTHPCVVLRRAEELDHHNGKKRRKRDPYVNEGKDLEAKVGATRIPIAFESVHRMNIFAGDIVFVRNREMIPADLILLASANEGGSAYVETSSIDGETNLKLRNSPHLPAQLPGMLASASGDINSGSESLKHAVQRIANMSLLGHKDGISALLNPKNADERLSGRRHVPTSLFKAISTRLSIFREPTHEDNNNVQRIALAEGGAVSYVTTLTSEPPNTHVNNYTGKLTLPPGSEDSRSESVPLNAENVLLRGAVLRNTEWVIGVACFTGADTKLVMNSVATPSKFSQLDMLINRTVVLVLVIMILCVCSLGALSTRLNKEKIGMLWYAGISEDPSERWPYFNLEGSSSSLEGSSTLDPPVWTTSTPNFWQNVFMFITMLSNFVPLSLYVSVEIITVMMMFYVGWDLNMYHAESDTPASAKSTIVTDLGLVQYIFSDKTGTLTCNIMEFKRCSVDGNIFGMPVAKAAPQLAGLSNEQNGDSEEEELDTAHPLKRLLAPGASVDSSQNNKQYASDKLTFNAEMFLRVMSICHTVVVEKDHVSPTDDSHDDSKGIKKTESTLSATSNNLSPGSTKPKRTPKAQKNVKKDGSPEGFAYQAESPDEGALVAAASNEYGFQLLGRDSSGVRISCSCPSLLEEGNIVEGMKNGTFTAKILAGKTAAEFGGTSKTVDEGFSPRTETWSILAINKFDSDRKRMSVLVRSPPELGSVPMLFCKGADSSMMLDGVCEGMDLLKNIDISNVDSESDFQNAEVSSLLGIQAHLGGKFVPKSGSFIVIMSITSQMVVDYFHRI